MKTKHILTALALPAMFAACTADDIVSVESNMQQDRAKLSENFVLKVGADGVESRYDANGGAPIFETGDKIGAALIDQFTYGEKVEDWIIIPSLANNTPFTFNKSTGEWNVPESQPMGIGNYFFKFPYDKTDRSRAAVIYSLPTVQNQYEEKNGEIDTDAAINNGNMAIATAVFNEDDEMGEISLKNIFTYPKFRIQFDNGEKVNTVAKVVLYNTDDDSKFIVKSGFIHQQVVDLFNNDDEDFYAENTYVTDWSCVDTYDLIYTEAPTTGDNAGVAEVVTSKYLIAQFPDDAEVKYDSNTENKYIDVRFVLPTISKMETTTENWGMLVYTDNGMYKYENVYKSIVWKKTTSDEVKETVFARGKNYNITLEALDEVEDAEELIVASVDEWNDFVEVYGDVKNGKKDIIIVGKEFGFDETTKMPEVAVFTVKGDATVKGEVTLSNVVVTGNVYVEEDAELTTSKTFEVTGAIYNEGAAIIAQVLKSNGKVDNYNKVPAIYNEGELTIEEETEATFAFYNAKGATVTNNGEINIKDAEIKNDEGKVLYNGSYGVINNNGVINLTDDFTVQYQDVAPSNAKNDKNASFIYNDGEIFAKNGDLIINNETYTKTVDGEEVTLVKGWAEVVNNEDAVMTCKNQNGEIKNYGQLTVVDGSVTYITENYNTITVDKAVPAELVVKNTKGTIEYDAEGSLSFENSIVNTIHVVDDLTITKMGGISTICVDNDAEITLPAAAAVSTLKIEEGEATLKKDLAVTSLSVAEDAELIIPAGVTLTVSTSSYKNEGIIRVAGSLIAQSVLAANGGTIKDNGTSATVKFYDEDDAELTAAWNAAVYEWATGKASSTATTVKGGWLHWLNDANSDEFYAGNPYDYEAFLTVVAHNDWSGRLNITTLVALYEAGLPAARDANGNLVTPPAKFTAAVNAVLKATANKTAAEASMYDVDGKFTKIGWTKNVETLFESINKAYDSMSASLNTKSVVNQYFDENAVVAAYVWADQATVFAKVTAQYPYSYIWISDEDNVCPLYDVCLNIMQASQPAWESFFGSSFTSESTITAKYVKDWLQAAAGKTDDTTLGKIAKKMSDAYYTSSLKWDYSNTQVSLCCKAALVELTGNSDSY